MESRELHMGQTPVDTILRKSGRACVLNSTFNTISVISWRSVLLVEGTGLHEEYKPICRKSLTNFITQCCIELSNRKLLLSTQLALSSKHKDWMAWR